MEEYRLSKRNILKKWFIYLVGMSILALGIILSTKSNLGVSPIVSVAYEFSEVYKLDFGNMTFAWYGFFVLVQIIIHFFRKEYKFMLDDLLQIPVSLVLTRFISLFGYLIPNLDGNLNVLCLRFILLILGIIFTGIGAAICLSTGLIPNPGDGIVKTIAIAVNKTLGLVKNIFDTSCVLLTFLIGYLLSGSVHGIGIGTILAMIGVGRVIAIYNMIMNKRHS